MCDSYLYTVHIEVVSHHVCWSIATATNIILVECRWKKDGCKSGVTCTECHYIRHVCCSRATIRCICLYSATLSDILFRYACLQKCSIRQRILSVTYPPDMPKGRVPLPRVCITCRLPSWTPPRIYQIMCDA